MDGRSASRSPDPAITGCQTLAHVKFTPATEYSDNSAPVRKITQFIIHSRSSVDKSCIVTARQATEQWRGYGLRRPRSAGDLGMREAPQTYKILGIFVSSFRQDHVFLAVLRQNSYWILVVRSGRNFDNNYTSPPPPQIIQLLGPGYHCDEISKYTSARKLEILGKNTQSLALNENFLKYKIFSWRSLICVRFETQQFGRPPWRKNNFRFHD